MRVAWDLGQPIKRDLLEYCRSLAFLLPVPQVPAEPCNHCNNQKPLTLFQSLEGQCHPAESHSHSSRKA